MSAYEELVERCAKRYCISLAEDDYSDAAKVIDAAWVRDKDDPARESFCAIARSVLSEVFRTLKNVTPEMDRAASGALQSYINGLTDEERAESGARKKGGCFVGPKTKHRERYFAMLRASPLAPPKEGK